MSAVPQVLDTRAPPLEVHETRDFRSYHAFLRAARNFIEGPLLGQLYDRYEQETTGQGTRPPAGWREAELARDPTPVSTIDPGVAMYLKHPAR